jgi:hypothetical protein
MAGTSPAMTEGSGGGLARARVGADGAAGVFRVETIRLKTDALRHAKARSAAALMQAGATVLS